MEDFTSIPCTINLEYTYKLTRGKLPEKVVLEKDRYWIPDLRLYPSIQMSIEKEGREICCIWDKKRQRFTAVTCRKTNHISKTIKIKSLDNKNIYTMYYIPLCVILLGDPKNIKSISIDHIDQHHNNTCLKNLRWASPTEQNINRTIVNIDEEFYDYEYYLDNIKFNSLLKVYNYCITNSKLKRKTKYENFKRTVTMCLDKNMDAYSLNIVRKIIILKDEEWTQLNNKYELVVFTYISNYGRLGRIKDSLILPRTVTINKNGYQRIKLKILKKEVGIHTLVYEHFKGDIPIGYIVDHIDENKSNNHITNLQILTQSENIKKTCNINSNHKQTVNIETTNLNTNEVLVFTNKEQFYKHYKITYSYYTYHSYKSKDGTIILNNVPYKINEIKNKTYEIGNKKRKIQMYNKDNMIKIFNSIADVSKYYKENNIVFHSPLFRKVINTDKEYNIPGILWKSEEIS